jgi:hypothetical protein
MCRIVRLSKRFWRRKTSAYGRKYRKSFAETQDLNDGFAMTKVSFRRECRKAAVTTLSGRSLFLQMADKTMKIALIIALFFLARIVLGDVPLYEPKVGDEYGITKTYETSTESSTGSSGSSRGSNAIVERIIGVREEGLEIEYDLPDAASEENRARTWQFPARVYRPKSGPMQLLNTPELEARIEVWLQAGGMTREACGRWIFTWNAFLVECDPESVIETLSSFDLRVVDLSDGASYKDVAAEGSGTIEKKATAANRETYAVTLKIDPEVMRRARAENDVVVGEILNEPVTLEEALSIRANEEVSGSLLVTFKADDLGNVWHRTKVVEVETILANGEQESEKSIEAVERHPIPSSSVLH